MMFIATTIRADVSFESCKNYLTANLHGINISASLHKRVEIHFTNKFYSLIIFHP